MPIEKVLTSRRRKSFLDERTALPMYGVTLVVLPLALSQKDVIHDTQGVQQSKCHRRPTVRVLMF